MRIAIVFILTLFPFCLLCQEMNDSIEDRFYELKEVVVSARNAKPLPDGLSIIPTENERRTSSSGTSLLERMQIPVLVIDPIDKSIKLNTGEKVSYFINTLPASEIEIKAIKPRDILDIQILRHPIDVKYNGVSAVVNFTVNRKKFGGYISLEGMQRFPQEIGNYDIYSKYATSQWTFQSMGGIKYQYLNGDIKEQNSTYYFDDINPIKISTLQEEISHRQRQYYGAVQAVRNNNNGSIMTLKLGIISLDNPNISWNGYTQYNETKTTNVNTNSMRRNAPYIAASYFCTLPRKIQLNAEVKFSASIGKSKSSYISSSNPDVIYNETEEHVYNPAINIYLTKKISSKDQVSASFDGNISVYNTDYSGTANTNQTLYSQNYKISATWRHSFNDNWMIQLMAGMPASILKINNDKTVSDKFPSYSLFANGTICNTHSILFYFSGSRNMRVLTSYNNVDREDTDYEGTSGNMGLKMTPVYNASASYTWLYSNKFQAAFSINSEFRLNDCVMDYFYKNGIIFNRLVNSGDYMKIEMNLRTTMKLLSGKLTVAPNLGIEKVSHSGIYRIGYWQPHASLSVQYMPSKKIFVSCDVTTPPGKIYYNNIGGYVKEKDWRFNIQGGYVLNNFTLQTSISPFYKAQTQVSFLEGSKVQTVNYNFIKSWGRSITLIVKYVFDFGKKTSRDKIFIENHSTTSVR